MAVSPTQSQNLIKQVSLDELRRTPGFWASVVLEAFSVVSAFLSGYLYRNYLDGGLIWWPLAAFGLFCAAFFFSTVLIRNFLRRLAVTALCAAAVIFAAGAISPLPQNAFLPAWELLLAPFFIFWICLVWGESVAKREMANDLNFRFFKISGSELSKIMTGAAFAAIVLYIPYWNVEDAFLSKGGFESVFNATTGFLNNFYPEVDFSEPVGSIAEQFSELQLRKNPAFANLPSASRKQMLGQVTDRFIVDLGKSLGTEINPAAPLSESVYDFLLGFLRKWQDKFAAIFLAGWAIGLFFLLKSAGAILSLILQVFGFFIYHTLITLNLIHVAHESVEKENVEFVS